MGSINYSQAIRPDIAYLRKIIESSLLVDWAIRIEYQSGESATNSWILWSEAFFAIRSAKPILDAILDCYIKHPRSTIRIYGEKFHPQTRLLYTAYNPQYLYAETESIPQTYSRQLPREQNQPSPRIRIIS